MHRYLALLLLAGCAVAQNATDSAAPTSAHLTEIPKVTTQVTNGLVPASHSDLYCSGFLAKAPARKDTFVLGGLNSPNQTRFHAHDFLFINGDFPVGSRVSIVRQTRDTNRAEAFKGQAAALKQTGDIFGELGYAVVIEKRGDSMVAQIEFSCDAIIPGDYVVPFVAKPEVNYRERTTLDRFPDKPQRVGRIIAARDFDQFVGTGQKVYVNIGSQKGIKAGDMFYVVRNYSVDEMDATDIYELKTGAFEGSRVNDPKMPKRAENNMPQRIVAEAVVLGVQEGSATAMITFALSEVHVGDRIAAEVPMPGVTESSNYAQHSAKHHLSKLCVFAVLGCDEPVAESQSGAPASAAPVSAAPAGGSK